MAINPDDPVFPVTEWDIMPNSVYGIILIRPSFLSHASQSPDQPNPGRVYALTIVQARQLVRDIELRLRYLETGGSPPVPPDQTEH